MKRWLSKWLRRKTSPVYVVGFMYKNPGSRRWEMEYPKTAEEWWKWVDQYWEDFFYILTKYIDIRQNATNTGRPDGKILECTILDDIKRCKKEREIKLAIYFQVAWELAPDSPCIHDNPNWLRFCDACSEASVLGG